ncbi:universal stress protein [Actinoplanes teichomyceticus]|uniref:Universal stress protein family protein n=1 Tax=Actinoplanes teichomyceticus TaxID=1867 RepID=A0A561WKD1_ACTTI|nr:universal stress protein [Actinoplanes teichomyceticus]TWG24283.1 universal stress protein family protein [Actinoplanes teichomyceticus]GIF12871.1 universal stress protein [Actinoplanes teichomyceticus]
MGKPRPSGDDRTVVAGIDGTTHSPAIVELAAAEATRRSARLLIVHAWPGHYRGRFRLPGPHPGPAEGGRVLALAAQHAATGRPGLTVQTRLCAGDPADALIDCSRNAEMLVIGHRDGKFGRPDWGTTARLLARACPGPLLVHRGQVPERGPVVLGVSGRPAEAAVGYAFAQAALTGAHLVVVHARQPSPDRWARHPFPVRADGDGAEQVPEPLAAALVEWSGRFPRVTVERLVIPDVDVPYTLARASRRARLLVAGTGGRGRLGDLIGVPAGRPERRPGLCPVLLVPADRPVRLPDAVRPAEARLTR